MSRKKTLRPKITINIGLKIQNIERSRYHWKKKRILRGNYDHPLKSPLTPGISGPVTRSPIELFKVKLLTKSEFLEKNQKFGQGPKVTRPSILCVTHQMSRKKRNHSVGSTVSSQMINCKYKLALDGTGSVSRSFDLLNSIIYWSVDLRWMIEYRCYIHPRWFCYIVFVYIYIYMRWYVFFFLELCVVWCLDIGVNVYSLAKATRCNNPR